MNPESWATTWILPAFAATCRQRSSLADQVTEVTEPEDLMLLAKSWPNLVKLVITDQQSLSEWPVAPAPGWAQLQHLNLRGSNLGAAGAQKLQAVPLPHLSSLNPLCTGINTAAIKHLIKASWPALEELNL